MTLEMELDTARVEAFGGKVMEMLNNSSLILMVSIGHQTGLFDKLAGLPVSTSQQIAEATGLNERYVREWLGAMVVGRIIDYDPANATYRLPAEHAAMLTRASGTNNLAMYGQYIPLLGNIEQELIECFRRGGGVPYSSFPRFQELQAEETRAIFDATLINLTLPLVSGLVEKLQNGIKVADFGCGQGHAINLMAQTFPASDFTGYDFSEDGTQSGQVEAAQLGLTNARFEKRDVATLDLEAQYDFITAFDAIHDQAKPRQVLSNIFRALKSGGTFLMVDIAASSHLHENIDHPIGPMLYTVSTTHCMTVSLAQNGEGLGTVWGEQTARQYLAQAGFNQVEVKRVDGDFFNYYYIATRPS